MLRIWFDAAYASLLRLRAEMYRLRAEESARQGDGTGAMSSALKAIACERMADELEWRVDAS